MFDWIFALVIGWNLVTVAEETPPQALVEEHECVEAIWWREDGDWNLWDTSRPFVESDFLKEGEGSWNVIRWMDPEQGYWVYCTELGGHTWGLKQHRTISSGRSAP